MDKQKIRQWWTTLLPDQKEQIAERASVPLGSLRQVCLGHRNASSGVGLRIAAAFKKLKYHKETPAGQYPDFWAADCEKCPHLAAQKKQNN
jgi:hypothetical protein